VDSYSASARSLVAQLAESAAASPHRAVAFQGAPGAYSHQAVVEIFPDRIALPCFSFADAIDAVRSGRAARAVIPVENSSHGRVADVHVLLPESGLSIVGEHFLKVEHNLLALPGATLDTVRDALSHEQALGQCRRTLQRLRLRPVVYSDTAGAAAFVADSGTLETAAVASRLASVLFGLQVLEAGISDEPLNTTRFLVLSPVAEHPDPREGPLMTTIMFEVRNVPAALFKALGGFATNGVNITKIESYQLGHGFTANEFYADVEGSPHDEPVARALEELAFFSRHVRLLGTYTQRRARISRKIRERP
jgi:prephenate dehydratase